MLKDLYISQIELELLANGVLSNFSKTHKQSIMFHSILMCSICFYLKPKKIHSDSLHIVIVCVDFFNSVLASDSFVANYYFRVIKHFEIYSILSSSRVDQWEFWVIVHCELIFYYFIGSKRNYALCNPCIVIISYIIDNIIGNYGLMLQYS